MIIFGQDINNKRLLIVVTIFSMLFTFVILFLIAGKSNDNDTKFDDQPTGINFKHLPTSTVNPYPTGPEFAPKQIIVELTGNIKPVYNAQNITKEELLNSNFKEVFVLLDKYGIENAKQVVEQVNDGDPLGFYYLIYFKEDQPNLDGILNDCQTLQGIINSCEKDVKLQPLKTLNDPLIGRSWYIKALNLPKAWDFTTGSIILGDIDLDCFNGEHPDLKEVLVNSHRGTSRACHGTNTAGSMAARGDNSIGVAGSCPNCRVHASIPVGFMSGLPNAIQTAVSAGAKTMSWSWGSHSIVRGVAYKAAETAYNNGLVIFASAGNCGNPNGRGGNPCDTYESPQDWPFIILVPASAENGRRTSFSSYSDMVKERGVIAPGQSILTTSGDGYGSVSGTSFSSPLASGVAGLMLSLKGNLTPAQIKQILFNTAIDKGPTGPDEEYGHGLVDACNALSCVQDLITGDPSCLSNPPVVHCTSSTVDPIEPDPIDPCLPQPPVDEPPTDIPTPPVGGPLPTVPINPTTTPYPTIGNPNPLPKIENCDCGWDIWCYLGCKVPKEDDSGEEGMIINTANNVNNSRIPATCVKPIG